MQKWEADLVKKARANANQRVKDLRTADLIESATANAIRSRFTIAQHTWRVNEFMAAKGLGEEFDDENPFWLLSEKDILDENNVRCTAWAEGMNADEAVSKFIKTRKIDWDALAKLKQHDGDLGAAAAGNESGDISVGDGRMNIGDTNTTMTIGYILKEGLMMAAAEEEDGEEEETQETEEEFTEAGKSLDQRYPDEYDLGETRQKLFFPLGHGLVQGVGLGGELSGD